MLKVWVVVGGGGQGFGSGRTGEGLGRRGGEGGRVKNGSIRTFGVFFPFVLLFRCFGVVEP